MSKTRTTTRKLVFEIEWSQLSNLLEVLELTKTDVAPYETLTITPGIRPKVKLQGRHR